MLHMSSERLWRELTDNKIPWPSSHLAQSCENELQELMLQIDKMIKEKTSDWDRNQENLLSKLTLKEQECQLLQVTLEERSKETNKLRFQLEESVKSKKACRAEYEAQVGYLRQEVQNMTRQYDRLRRKLEKQARQLDREKERVATDGIQIDTTERRALERQLEGAMAERATLGQRAEAAEAARQALEEKCAFLQAQTQTYQKQLDKRKQILETSEKEFQVQLSNLEEQLRSARDSLTQQVSKAERLKKTVEVTTEDYKQAIDDRELRERDLRSAKQTIARYEEDLRRVGGELNRKEKQLSRSEAELCTRLAELREAQETIRLKGEALAAAEAARRADLLPEEAERLRREAEEAQEAAKAHRAAERRAQDELAMAAARVADLEQYNAQLLERLQKAKSGTAHLQTYEVSNLKDELRKGRSSDNPSAFPSPVISFCELASPKAREQVAESEEAHAAALTRQRRYAAEVEASRGAAQRREHDFENRLSGAERRLKTAQEEGDRLAAELHVANAQLEALRLENRHLKASTAVHTSPFPAATAARVAREAAAGWSSGGSEQSGSGSGSGVELPQARLEPPPRAGKAKNEKSPLTSPGPAPSGYPSSSSTDRIGLLTKQVTELSAEKEVMARELETQVETLKRLSLENKAMAKFVSGVSHALSASPRGSGGTAALLQLARSPLPPLVTPHMPPGPSGDLQTPTASTRGLFRQVNNNNSGKEDKREEKEEETDTESLRSLLKAASISGMDFGSAADSLCEPEIDPTVQRFLVEERERSLELEQLLNAHIESFKRESARTLDEYRREMAEGDGASSPGAYSAS